MISRTNSVFRFHFDCYAVYTGFDTAFRSILAFARIFGLFVGEMPFRGMWIGVGIGIGIGIGWCQSLIIYITAQDFRAKAGKGRLGGKFASALLVSAIICPQSRICKVNSSVVQGNNTEKVITNKSKCRIALRRNAALLPVRPHYLWGDRDHTGKNVDFTP